MQIWRDNREYYGIFEKGLQGHNNKTRQQDPGQDQKGAKMVLDMGSKWGI